MSWRRAVALVAGREIRERAREKSFLVSTGINLVIVIVVIVLSTALGGNDDRTRLGHSPQAAAVAEAAQRADPRIELRELDPAEGRAQLRDGAIEAYLTPGGVDFKEEPDAELAAVLQAASRQATARRALERSGLSRAQIDMAVSPPPLEVESLEPVDEEDEETAGFTFFVVLMLWGQLIGFGYWVAAGVVEEKASRVVEVVLATIRPGHLLAGKTIGLGLLALAQLLLVAVVGLAAAGVSGALDIDGAILRATVLALAWFVVGYAFYACAFACAGALVPRQEELQSSMTPLNVLLFAAFFLAFFVRAEPDGTLAHVTAFLPFTAPITMPPRIVTGDASALEIVASFAITIAAAAALIPLAARIYAGGILRTGSALKLREAWRAAGS